MTKRNKIIYWIATIWLCLGMVSGAIIQVMQHPLELEMMKHLGYPSYFLILLGTWKFLGVIAVLVPKYPLVKEWAYAGFFFAMTGAVYSHIAVKDPAMEMFGPVLLIVLTITSWYFRPADRKLSPTA